MARRKAPIIPDELLDQLLAGRDPHSALGQGGLLDELKRALAERALNTEMDCHLDGEAAEGRSNSRNGYGRKTVLTETGKLPIAVPRDRLATFESQLIAKYRRRLPGFDDKVVSMYARGLSVLELAKQLGNVSQACKLMGYSRDSFYRFKERFLSIGSRLCSTLPSDPTSR